MSKRRGFRPRALGEIAIRCADMRAMVSFYETVIGLERLHGDHNSVITFFRIAEGFGGHTQVLALFQDTSPSGSELPSNDLNKPVTGTRSALHHIALSLPFEEQDAVMAWYETVGQSYRIEEFGWIGWRGIFTNDPEGNTVELVAFDPSMLTQA